MHDAGLHDRVRPNRGAHLGEVFERVAYGDAHVFDARGRSATHPRNGSVSLIWLVNWAVGCHIHGRGSHLDVLIHITGDDNYGPVTIGWPASDVAKAATW
jgi:hypothetical protein